MSFVTDTQIHLFVKVALLIFAGLYTLFAIFMYFQIGQLEKWLMSLRRYHFRKWALVHLALAGAGILLGLVLL